MYRELIQACLELSNEALRVTINRECGSGLWASSQNWVKYIFKFF